MPAFAFDSHKNFAITTVTTVPTPATSGTTLIVSDATIFPATPFNAVVWPINTQPTATTAEVIRVTSIVGNTLTITRNQESSIARAITVGDAVANNITARALTDIESILQSASVITTTGTSAALALPTGAGNLVIFANNATALTVQGIAAGSDGQHLTIFSIGAGNLIFQNQNVGASAANRLITPQANDQTLTAGVTQASFIYDLTVARWRMYLPTSLSTLDLIGATTQTVSASGHAALFYNSTAGTIQASLNGAAYTDLGNPTDAGAILAGQVFG